MMNEVLWAAGMTTVTQCYSVRGLDVVAGLNIASTITNLFNIVYLQLGSCISIVVGQYLGAGKLEDAKDADNKMIVFSVFCCVIMPSSCPSAPSAMRRILPCVPVVRRW